MKKFLYRIAKLSIPFWVILASIVLLDPFGFLWRNNETQNLLLTEISKNNDRPLFNLLQLNKKNPEIIVIGDSRSDQLNLDNCQNKKQENTSLNVSMGGATIFEIFEMTNHALNSEKNLKQIMLGINFDIFSVHNTRNRVTKAYDIIEHPHKYFYHKPVITSIIQYFSSEFFHKEIKRDKLDMTKEEFWQYQLSTPADNSFRNHSITNELYDKLDEIIKMCQNRDIKLTVFIPPTHTDLQRKIIQYNKIKEFEFLKDYLGKHEVQIINLDIENSFTNDKSNFIDPYHLHKSVINKMCEIL